MIRTPDHLEIRDERFRALVHPMGKLEQLCTGFTWTEGPVWFGDRNALIFSEIPSQTLYQWTEGQGLSVFREESQFNNGNTRDPWGRLVGCRHGTRDVVRTEYDGALTVLASEYEGKRLNSPNDVVVSSDGAVWFTDPTYGIISNFEGNRAEPEQAARHVFRIPPGGGAPVPVISDFAQPNGLCFSPDESILYVAESGSSHDDTVPPVIRKYAVDGETLTSLGDFATLDCGLPDGMRCDVQGNLWSSAGDGVHCFAPDGTLLGKILVPEVVANLCFGGPDGQRMYITATSSVYRVFVDVKGAEPWTRSARA
ncbi:SMP-30/gluconolactonase/LRE family protein [Alloyangia pacifica]|uniref:Gluconolactonase n=1 Tax=Alloyangia pacifica TaxID=311180 RepID=A0A1I6QYK5_9RHOB|nr:SMP-30/gluconolactonase/LRE family protein [Alloyangia pacifica]SDG05155.1 gluconolactonase [Alloyangia pacifica]SFS57440.1 gluconolactonase [Alloyangia pacifica]